MSARYIKLMTVSSVLSLSNGGQVSATHCCMEQFFCVGECVHHVICMANYFEKSLDPGVFLAVQFHSVRNNNIFFCYKVCLKVLICTVLYCFFQI
jgi:hypothetical protein